MAIKQGEEALKSILSDLSPSRPTILITTDSARIHTGLANSTREIFSRLHKTGHYNILQLGWADINGTEKVPWKIVRTRTKVVDAPSGKKTMILLEEDKYGQQTFPELLGAGFKPDLVWCFRPGTEAITRRGRVLIEDLSTEDEVLSVSPETGEVSYKKVVATQTHQYSGNMINISTTRGIDLSVTPEHKLLLRNKYSPKYQWMTAQELFDHKTTTYRYFPEFAPVVGERVTSMCLSDAIQDSGIPYNERHGNIPNKICINNYLELLGWIISEGSCSKDQIAIAQARVRSNGEESETRHDLEELLSQIGLEFSSVASGVRICRTALSQYFGDLCGRGAANKRIPEFVFELDHTHLEHLYRTLMLGDGNTRGNTYTTVSEDLAYGFLRLCTHLGKRSRIVSEYNDNYTGGVVYKVYISLTQNKCGFSHANVWSDTYDGPVHCCTVENNHTLLAGRNGCFQFVGHCYGDPWMVKTAINVPQRANYFLLSYITIDGAPAQPRFKEVYEKSDLTVVTTNFGKEVLAASDVRADYIPLGVDLDTFKVLPDEDRARYRNELFGLKEDDILIGLVGRNQPRKMIPEAVRALYYIRSGRYIRCNNCHRITLDPHHRATLEWMGPNEICRWCHSNRTERVPPMENVYMYVHAVIDEHYLGWNLMNVVRRYFQEKPVPIWFNENLTPPAGVPANDMAVLYNCMDIFTLPTYAEGFGLPLLEAMACGRPIVTSNANAHIEFCSKASELVETVQYCEPRTECERNYIVPEDYVDKLQDLCNDKEMQTMLGAGGVKVAASYGWDGIAEQWDKLFQRLLKTKIHPYQIVAEM